MDKDDLKKLAEVLREYRILNIGKLEFSKILTIFFCVLIAAAFLVAAFSWIAWREIPSELLAWVTALISVCGVPYMIKSALENKAKIDNGKEALTDVENL